jgi:hypothetical protein
MRWSSNVQANQPVKSSIQAFLTENYLFSFTSTYPTLDRLHLVIISTLFYMYWLDKRGHYMWCYFTCKHVSLFKKPLILYVCFLQNLSIMNILNPIFYITCCFYDFRQWPPDPNIHIFCFCIWKLQDFKGLVWGGLSQRWKRYQTQKNLYQHWLNIQRCHLHIGDAWLCQSCWNHEVTRNDVFTERLDSSSWCDVRFRHVGSSHRSD